MNDMHRHPIVSDADRVKGLLDGTVDPSQLEDDPELYSMAERIYGREALDEMGISPPEVPIAAFDESDYTNGNNLEVELPDEPEIIDSVPPPIKKRSRLPFFAGLIGLISSSIAIIWQKKTGSNLSISGNNFLQALSASIFHFFLALCFEDFFINFSNDFLLAMSWQIFAVSLGAFLILMWLLQNNKANQTSTLFFLVPPTSALLAYLILNEKFILIDFLGLFLSCLGVFIVSKFQENINLK